MRVPQVLLLATSLMGSAAWAQQPLIFPPGAEAREAALLVHAGPATRRFIAREAAREAGMGTVSEPVARAAAGENAAALGAITAADVDALVLLVMMQATRDADAGLRDQITEMQQQNAKKRTARTAIAAAKANEAGVRAAAEAEYERLRRTGGIAPSTTLADYLASHPVPAPRPFHTGPSPAETVPPADATIGELGELSSLRLTALAERRAKMMEAISSTMTKGSATERNIVDNMK
jgi:hypothetical protein